MKTTAIFILQLILFCGLSWAEINLQDVEIPDIDDVAAIKDRCESKGGKGTYDKVKAAKTEFQNCVQGLVDITILKDEVEEAKKTGSMDEVFGKYCNKRPKVKSCVVSLTDAIKPCLEDSEKQALNITLDILRQLGEFVCYRDGDRIAMFVAEGGVECIKDHTEGIKDCVNNTFKINTSIDTTSFPTFLIDSKKCKDLGRLQNCVVDELEKCKDSTPANIVDALFRFVKRSACPSTKSKRSAHYMVKRSTALLVDWVNQSESRNNLFKFIKDKCSTNAPGNGYRSFTNAVETTVQCIKSKLSRNRIFITPANQFKQNVEECTATLVNATTDCLPPSEKYFPQFYLDTIYSLIDFLYANQDKIFAKTINVELAHCLQRFNGNEAKRSFVNCLTESDESFANAPSIQDKQTTCARLENFKKCATSEIDKRCISDITITQLKNGLFDAVTAPCNKKNI